LNAAVIEDGNLLFNWLFKILAPILCCIVIGVFLHFFNLGNYSKKLWAVVFLCWLFRFSYNLIFVKFKLINIYEFFSLSFIYIGLGYFININLNENPKSALPSWDNLVSEIWLLLVFFIYQIFNELPASNLKTRNRKDNYFREKFKDFKKLYASQIFEITQDVKHEKLIYSIIIYENFNRPSSIRKLENIISRYKANGTYGIMQIKSILPLTDSESVRLGAIKIIELFLKVEKATLGNPENEDSVNQSWVHSHILNRVIWLYNNSDDYVQQVLEIHSFLTEHFYTPLKDQNPELLYDAFYSRHI
jgi:hypothetical protein